MTSRRPSPGLWLVVGAVILGGLVLGWLRPSAPPPGNLAGSSLGGHFMLTNQDGRPVSDGDFKGKYRLIYFGYTFCPDVCPTDVAVIARGLKAFEAAAPALAGRVQPIFITVDPERDDPAALKAFVAAFHPRLVGLTGSPTAIAAVQKAYGVYSRKMPTSATEADPQSYLVDHFAIIYLFGPDGAPIAFLPHGSEAKDVTALLQAQVR